MTGCNRMAELSAEDKYSYPNIKLTLDTYKDFKFIKITNKKRSIRNGWVI